MRSRRILAAVLALAACLGSGCAQHAAPPPYATFGSEMAPRGGNVVGLGVGSGAELFSVGHLGGTAWMGRWGYGLRDDTDLIVDAGGLQRQDEAAIAGKVGVRRRVGQRARLDFGLGAADDSDGKSMGAEFGLVIGDPDRPRWRYYAGLKAVTAWGILRDDEGILPRTVAYAMLSAGATAPVSDRLRFVMEGGASPVFIEGESEVGVAFYFGVGILGVLPRGD